MRREENGEKERKEKERRVKYYPNIWVVIKLHKEREFLIFNLDNFSLKC